ncbi:hypothetical protein PM082_024961 [Marasmius tenuissimus]|nr:hypothetical protein PM082_024961 [Marasmius tenuissimus]
MLDITTLCVLHWAVSDTSVEAALSMFRNLKQFGLELASPVSKKRLLKLSERLATSVKLVEISLVLPSKRARLSRKDQEHILEAWKNTCSSLQSIRLDRDSKYTWDARSLEWNSVICSVEKGCLPISHRGLQMSG